MDEIDVFGVPVPDAGPLFFAALAVHVLAAAVAELARRVAERLGGLQDIEWAIQDGCLYLLQARPMTAVPVPVAWTRPRPGCGCATSGSASGCPTR